MLKYQYLTLVVLNFKGDGNPDNYYLHMKDLN